MNFRVKQPIETYGCKILTVLIICRGERWKYIVVWVRKAPQWNSVRAVSPHALLLVHELIGLCPGASDSN